MLEQLEELKWKKEQEAKQVNIRLKPDEYSRLHEFSKKHGMSMSGFMRFATLHLISKLQQSKED